MIPIQQCKHHYLYKILARNFDYGIFDKNTISFIGIRYKFGTYFLDNEYHYDYNNGTAIPIKEIRKLPENICIEISNHTFDEKKIFKFLDDYYKENINEID